KPLYLLMFAAMGVATLIKGPVGAFLPGIVILFYMLMAQKWFLLRQMKIYHGALLFLAIAAPWYVFAEIRNPGYLRYFLREENVARFLTSHFNRSEPPYYFLEVLAVGFLPWTFLLPYSIRVQWKQRTQGTTLFLMLWTVLPFLFFSLSQTKLPHYILGIYPPLAILVGTALAGRLSQAKHSRLPLWFPGFNLLLIFGLFSIRIYWPELLPHSLQETVRAVLHEVPGLLLFALLLATTWVALSTSRQLTTSQTTLYLLCCGGFALYFFCVQPIVNGVSQDNSSKLLAQQLASLIRPSDQLVMYDDFSSSLPFYLRIERPIWVVSSKKDHSIIESYYVVEKRPQPAAVYGSALFPLEEFSQVWETSGRRLFVLLREKNLRRLVGQDRNLPEIIMRTNRFVLVTNH
ncbi:MAG TPA: hypothetical protein VLX11_15450, partial [Candidatus Acidoferrales bacterium]|nr:hypothetical protein [Candidatus Acidoferrales bacterium]